MSLSQNPLAYITVGSGILIALVALWVGSKGHFRGRYLAFAIAEGGFGLAVASANLDWVLGFEATLPGDSMTWPIVAQLGATMLSLAAVVGLAMLLRTHPDDASRGFHMTHSRMWPFFAALASVALIEIPYQYGLFLGLTSTEFWIFLAGAGFDFLFAAQFGAVATLALVYARIDSRNMAARRETVLFAVALAIYPIVRIGALWSSIARPASPQIDATGWAFVQWSAGAWYVFLMAMTAAAWLYAGRRQPSRAPGNMILYLATLFSIGAAQEVFAPDFQGLAALSRIAMFLVFAYAILRHQYLGIDLKVRWGISKTTVAGLFIAVFFVVSELAASVFSEQWGTTTGIVAAGLLVFGIAPIMRWADRFAATAVPAEIDNGEAIYRAAFRTAIADSNISPEEEVNLAEVAERLGLGPKRVAELRLQTLRSSE